VANATCSGGTCLKCPTGQTVCSNGCYDTNNDSGHCGATCRACAGATPSCKAGACACRLKSSGNVLNNPGIDGASSWDLLGGAKYDSTTDIDGCSGSGSLLIPPMLGPSFSSCVHSGVNPSFPYVFGYLFKGNGQGLCDVSFCSDTACQNCSGGDTALVASSGTWVAATINVSSPAGTVGAYVHCSSAAGDGNYDRFYLSSSGTF
jgi:hypothetical protein